MAQAPDDRVFFQVFGLDSVYKLKLSCRSAFKHLFSHVPAHRSAPGPDAEVCYIWHDLVLDPDMSPHDYAMAPGESNAHALTAKFRLRSPSKQRASLPPETESESETDQRSDSGVTPLTATSSTVDDAYDDHVRRGPPHSRGASSRPSTYYVRGTSSRQPSSSAERDRHPTAYHHHQHHAQQPQEQEQHQQRRHYPAEEDHDPQPQRLLPMKQAGHPTRPHVPDRPAARRSWTDEELAAADDGDDRVGHRSVSESDAGQGGPAPPIGVPSYPESLEGNDAALRIQTARIRLGEVAKHAVVMPPLPQQQQQQHKQRTPLRSAPRISSPTPDHAEPSIRTGASTPAATGTPGLASSHATPGPSQPLVPMDSLHTEPSGEPAPSSSSPPPHQVAPPQQHSAGRDAEYQRAAAQHEAALRAQSEHVESLEHDAAALRAKAAQADMAIATLQDAVAERDRRLEEQSAARKDTHATLSAQLVAEQQQHARAVETLQLQLASQKKANDQLRTKLRDADLALIEAKSSARTAAEGEQAAELHELRRQLSALEGYKTQRDRAAARVQVLEAELADVHAREATSRDFADTQGSELDRITSELDAVKAEYAEAMGEMRADIESLNAQNEALVNESAVASQNAIRMKGEMITLEERCAAQLEELERLRVAGPKAESEVAKWQQTASQLNATVQSLRDEVAAANKARDAAQRDAEDATRDRDAAVDDMRDAQARLADMRRELAQLRTARKEDNSDAEQTVRQLEAALVEVNTAVIAAQKESTALRKQLLELQQQHIAELRDVEAAYAARDPPPRTSTRDTQMSRRNSFTDLGTQMSRRDSGVDLAAQRSASQPAAAAPNARSRSGSINHADPTAQRSGSSAAVFESAHQSSPAPRPRDPAAPLVRGPSTSMDPSMLPGAGLPPNSYSASYDDSTVPSNAVPPLTPRAGRARVPGQVSTVRPA